MEGREWKPNLKEEETREGGHEKVEWISTTWNNPSRCEGLHDVWLAEWNVKMEELHVPCLVGHAKKWKNWARVVVLVVVGLRCWKQFQHRPHKREGRLMP